MKKILATLPALALALPILFALACSNNNAAPNAANAPADAASGANNATASNTGNDMYYEYTITSVGKNMNLTGYSKLYVSSGGSVRGEMQMINPAVKTTAPIVVIATSDKPNQTISIDDDAKTYTVNILDTATTREADPFKMESTVTKVGEDRIMGFNGVHARVISTRNMGPMGKMSDTIDIWNSPDVPLAPFFRHYMDKNVSKSWTTLMTPAAADQLKQMGCSGFMLKMQSGSKYSGMNMQLTKVNKADFAKSMFEIPAGYKEEKQ